MDSQEIHVDSERDGSSYPLTNVSVEVRLDPFRPVKEDSNQVRSTVCVDYRWESKVYNGSLVSVHRSGTYLAYILHGTELNQCAVRILNIHTKQRVLIKNFTEQALDVAWSYALHRLYLAVVDQGGNLFVYSVDGSGSTLNVAKFFHLKRSNVGTFINYRIIWCPFIDEDPSLKCDEFSSSNETNKPTQQAPLRLYGLLALSHDQTAEIIDLEPLMENHGREATVESCCYGFASVKTRSRINAMALSPDGTALALALQSGEVIFYIMESLNDLKEAHRWIPYNEMPVTAIFFLDNIASPDVSSSFWRYVVAASQQNREFKIFNCESWKCISSLKIVLPDEEKANAKNPLVLAIDWTANYFFISDVDRSAFYVIEISQNSSTARFSSFAHFCLVKPILSYAVLSASKKRFHPFSPLTVCRSETPLNLEDYPDAFSDDEKVAGIRIAFFAVNPKSLLEMEIRYQPGIIEGGDQRYESVSSKPESYRDELSDLSVDVNKAFQTASSKSDVSFSSFGASLKIADSDTIEKRLDHIVRQRSQSPENREVRTILSNENSENLETSDTITNLLDAKLNLREDLASYLKETSSLALITTASKSSSEEACSENLFEGTNGDKFPPHLYSALHMSMAELKHQIIEMTDQIQKQKEEAHYLKSLVLKQNESLQTISQALITKNAQANNFTEISDVLSPENLKEALSTAFRQYIHSDFGSSFKDDVLSDMSASLANSLSIIDQNAETRLHQRLSSFDTSLHAAVSKLVNSQQTLDTLGKACSLAICEQAQSTNKQAFQTTFAPFFEAASRSLFQQINDIFRSGTEEYLNQLKRQTALNRTDYDEFCNNIKSLFDKHAASINMQMVQTFEQCSSNLATTTVSAVFGSQGFRDALKDEVKKAFIEAQPRINDVMIQAFRSGAPTPVMTSPNTTTVGAKLDRAALQQELLDLLYRKEYGSAFQRALNALDLSLVTFLCSKVEPSELFSNADHRLSPPIVLSLVQQLSQELETHTTLKLKFLTEAVISIESKRGPLMQPQQVMRVLTLLEQKLTVFTLHSASNPFASQIRILRMAAQSLTMQLR